MEALMAGSPCWGGVHLFDPLSSGFSGVRFFPVFVGSGLVGGSRAFSMTDGRSMENVPSIMD
jgi:hypothetical protein